MSRRIVLYGVQLCLCTVYLTVTAIPAVYGQEKDSVSISCERELRRIYRAEARFLETTLSSGQLWRLQYRLTSNVYDGVTDSYRDVATEGLLVAGKWFRYTQTGNAEVYMDSVDVFTVSHDRRSVMHTPGTPLSLRSGIDMYGGGVMGDSLLKDYRIKECVTSGSSVRYLLVPRKDRVVMYGSIELTIDPGSGIIRRMLAEVNGAYSKDVRRYDLEVQHRKAVRNTGEWKRMRDRVLDGSGKLKGKYKGYRYRDLRE